MAQSVRETIKRLTRERAARKDRFDPLQAPRAVLRRLSQLRHQAEERARQQEQEPR